MQDMENLEDAADDSWTRSKAEEIVNSVLGSYKSRVAGYELGIMMYINSLTGKVVGTLFNFLSTDPFATIPVSAYRQIEQELINNIYFVPTAEGRKFNYLVRGWNQKIR